MTESYKFGDKVRVKANASRHAGIIGYVDCVGEGPSKGTIILCTENRSLKPVKGLYFRNSPAVIVFAICEKDIEKIA